MFLADAPSVGSIGASFGCLTGSAETLFVESSVLKHLQADRELLVVHCRESDGDSLCASFRSLLIGKVGAILLH